MTFNLTLSDQQHHLIEQCGPLPPSPPLKKRKLPNSPEKEKLPSSPEKWYRIIVDENNKIKVDLTPRVKQVRNVIYIFKNIMNGCVLVGMTGQKVSSRVSQYQVQFNSEKFKIKSEFYKEVKANPEHFKFGVLYQAKENEDLSEIEKTYILFQDFLKRYNKNKGGGGSTTTIPASHPLLPLTQAQLEQLKSAIPEKFYQVALDETSGVPHVQLTPKGAKKSGIIYGIQDENGHWLIGKTERSLQERMYGYHSFFKHNPTHPLAVKARTAPEGLSVFILKEDMWGEELSFMEKTFISLFDSVRNGYNRNGGGGGGSAQRTARQLLDA